MKVTPLEIRQKAFEKQFRGFDTNEVNAFLLTLSQEWERTVDELKEYKIKLEASEKEVNKLREVESSLFKTLKTAEDTGANVVEQARQAAELQIREASLKADGIVAEAKAKAKVTTEEVEKKAREVLTELENKTRNLSDLCSKLESQRDTLLAEMRHVAEDVLERLGKMKRPTNGADVDQELTRIHQEMDQIFQANGKSEASEAPEPEPVIAEPEPIHQKTTKPQVAEPVGVRTGKSFFDEIG